MPPALSETSSVSSGEEQIPAVTKAKKEAVVEDVDEQEDEEDEEEEDQFVVEKIISHRTAKGGVLEYDVKWQGWDNPKDRTWEPEKNMEGAIDVLREYWEEIGGKPEPKTKKRKGRKSVAEAESASGTPASASKRVKKEWSPPPGSWEHDVATVDTVDETPDPKTGEKTRNAYLIWKDNHKTQHPLSLVYQKCPQKMLEYYESHLVFTSTDATNGDDSLGMNDMY